MAPHLPMAQLSGTRISREIAPSRNPPQSFNRDERCGGRKLKMQDWQSQESASLKQTSDDALSSVSFSSAQDATKEPSA